MARAVIRVEVTSQIAVIVGKPVMEFHPAAVKRQELVTVSISTVTKLTVEHVEKSALEAPIPVALAGVRISCPTLPIVAGVVLPAVQVKAAVTASVLT